mgnify:CR=1 FL=1
MQRRQLWALAVAVATACTGGEQAQQEEQAEPVDTLAEEAAAAFDPAGFDTISWETDQAALERGSVVYSYSCAKCHGRQGFGDGGFVSRGDTLQPPSFHQSDWEYADDPEGLRQVIFTGGGHMPHWGLEGLPYRDVDAVARYILEGMRGSG